MAEGIGLGEALLGLDGFRVLEVTETDAEVVIGIETTADVVGCDGGGTPGGVAGPNAGGDPGPSVLRSADTAVVAQAPVALPDADCDAKSWTETCPQVTSRSVLTRRAGMEACRQVGMNARPVAGLAHELGVCWWTRRRCSRPRPPTPRCTPPAWSTWMPASSSTWSQGNARR